MPTALDDITARDLEYECPISFELMQNPVVVNCCKKHFEKTILENYLKSSDSCPLCTQKINTYLPDEQLQKKIQDFIKNKSSISAPVDKPADRGLLDRVASIFSPNRPATSSSNSSSSSASSYVSKNRRNSPSGYYSCFSSYHPASQYPNNIPSSSASQASDTDLYSQVNDIIGRKVSFYNGPNSLINRENNLHYAHTQASKILRPSLKNKALCHIVDAFIELGKNNADNYLIIAERLTQELLNGNNKINALRNIAQAYIANGRSDPQNLQRAQRTANKLYSTDRNQILTSIVDTYIALGQLYSSFLLNAQAINIMITPYQTRENNYTKIANIYLHTYKEYSNAFIVAGKKNVAYMFFLYFKISFYCAIYTTKAIVKKITRAIYFVCSASINLFKSFINLFLPRRRRFY